MIHSDEHDKLLVDHNYRKYIEFVKTHVAFFPRGDESYDNYMCNYGLFLAYCMAQDIGAAMETLARLERFSISEDDRDLWGIADGLASIKKYELARFYTSRQYNAALPRLTEERRVGWEVRYIFQLLEYYCDDNPRDPEVRLLIDRLSFLSCGHRPGATCTITIFEKLMPLSLVPPTAIVILQAIWAYMKCDEAFGGNNYGEKLAKIEAWLVQLADRASRHRVHEGSQIRASRYEPRQHRTFTNSMWEAPLKNAAYDQMQAGADCSHLLAEDPVGLAAYMKPFVAASAKDDADSYDHYMCTLALFNAYAYAGDKAAAVETLQVLDAIDIVAMKRMPETVSFDLTQLADFAHAYQLVTTAITVIDAATVDHDCRTLHLVPVHATKLHLLATHDVNNPEIPVLLALIRDLAYGYKFYCKALIAAYDILVDAGILVTKDVNSLYSLWTYMKVDERFYGNHHADDLAKVDSWIRQLYPPPHKFIFETSF